MSNDDNFFYTTEHKDGDRYLRLRAATSDFRLRSTEVKRVPIKVFRGSKFYSAFHVLCHFFCDSFKIGGHITREDKN
jgi:hypothetical protein